MGVLSGVSANFTTAQQGVCLCTRVCVCVCVEHMVFFPQTGCLLLMAVATTAIKSDGNFNKIQRAGVRLSVER